MTKTFKQIKNVEEFDKLFENRTCQVLTDDGSVCGKQAVASLAENIEQVPFNTEYDICSEHVKSLKGESLKDVKGLDKH